MRPEGSVFGLAGNFQAHFRVSQGLAGKMVRKNVMTPIPDNHGKSSAWLSTDHLSPVEVRVAPSAQGYDAPGSILLPSSRSLPPQMLRRSPLSHQLGL